MRENINGGLSKADDNALLYPYTSLIICYCSLLSLFPFILYKVSPKVVVQDVIEEIHASA